MTGVVAELKQQVWRASAGVSVCALNVVSRTGDQIEYGSRVQMYQVSEYRSEVVIVQLSGLVRPEEVGPDVAVIHVTLDDRHRAF